MNRKKISIICATFNAGKTLSNFLKSVKDQTVKDFELILIDGGSKDDTRQIINNNSEYINKVIFEPDEGIYDAWNKGLKLAKGEWICFVGSDDRLHADFIETYSIAINNLEEPCDYISSKVNYIDDNGKNLMVLGRNWCWNDFKYQMSTAHVGSMHNINLFQEVGTFDKNYKIVGDYELLLRKKRALKTVFIDEITVDMLYGGVSLTYASLLERRKAQIKTGALSYSASYVNLLKGYLALMKFNLNVK